MRLSPQARCTLPMGSCEAGTDGSWTLRWREMDSNIGPRSPVSSVGAARRSCLRGSGSGSALLLLRFGPLYRTGLGHGLSR